MLILLLLNGMVKIFLSLHDIPIRLGARIVFLQRLARLLPQSGGMLR